MFGDSPNDLEHELLRRSVMTWNPGFIVIAHSAVARDKVALKAAGELAFCSGPLPDGNPVDVVYMRPKRAITILAWIEEDELERLRAKKRGRIKILRTAKAVKDELARCRKMKEKA